MRELRTRFARIFFCAGNYDLWVGKKDSEDSVAKLRRVLRLCADLGVDVAPATIDVGPGKRVLVVPLLSWHHPQWDTEAEIQGWTGGGDLRLVSDYHRTKWPPPTNIKDGSAARLVDAMNDEIFSTPELLERREGHDAVLSFSHFVPRLEVNPEKIYLIPPVLAKAVGSTYLSERVQELRPDVHVFGHTHFGYDLDVGGIRYLQAALAGPNERNFGGSIVALGEFPEIARRPVLVWDSDLPGGWAPRHRSAWSLFYSRYGRCPEMSHAVPSVVADASGMTPASADCRSGWIAGRMPVWLFGPLPHRLHEAQVEIGRLRARLEAERREAEEERGARRRSPKDEPRVVQFEELRELVARGRCTLVDVRADAEAPRNGLRAAWSVALPHPRATEGLAGLDDEALLGLCERLNATGVMALHGEGEGHAAECREAALLLAGLFRVWPREVLVLEGGLRAWVRGGGAVEQAA